ncbi:two-component sensor histidine kinase [Sphaerisporangium rufum]|uniref:histidine kinase n=1 Tax=Sphaerisporangium rufum TaxID=1381558 RepID=A0A919UWQ2_9ACTN|nr:sensor histidine kinase [Sphaerisporangium rufum]GII75059.1 two-component sensor histidine kinase [Sphaerisporangium rufum]
MFGRMRAFRARHQTLADALVVVPVFALCLVMISDDAAAAMGGGWAGYVALSAALLAPLGWRRHRPILVFAAVALISFTQWAAGCAAIPANMAVVVAMYAVAAYRDLPWALAAGAISELGIALVVLPHGGVTMPAFVTGSLAVITAWVSGIYANMRRRYLEGLEERAERAERERDQRARIAIADERARIARELHDVVAHNVSVMIVQADGAGYAIDSDPEQARAAVRTVAGTGRQALAEMRRLVGVLREDDDRPEEYAPQPGVADLDRLVAQVRRSGMPVEFTVNGTPHELAEGEQLVIYRVVQEALTNALKHGGPGVRASVTVDHGPAEVTLMVTDDGRGAAAPQSTDGHGLIGMRERVAMYDGSVRAAPGPGGGFQVSVRLPVSRAA